MHGTSVIQSALKGPLKIVVVGHVDHGKSTVIGQLLRSTGSISEQKLAEVESAARARGMQTEWSFLLDSLKAERDQAITIDTTEIRFKERDREYIIIDAPGHREFVRNMVTGAARGDAALLVLDANEGVRQQSKLHARLLRLLGVEQLVVLVNKMDLVNYSQARFAEISGEIEAYLDTLGLRARHVIPISASAGDNFTKSADTMNWYGGPDVVSALRVFSAQG